MKLARSPFAWLLWPLLLLLVAGCSGGQLAAASILGAVGLLWLFAGALGFFLYRHASKRSPATPSSPHDEQRFGLTDVAVLIRTMWSDVDVRSDDKNLLFRRGQSETMTISLTEAREAYLSARDEQTLMNKVAVLVYLSIQRATPPDTGLLLIRTAREAIKSIDPHATFEIIPGGCAATIHGVRCRFSTARIFAQVFGASESEYRELLTRMAEDAYWEHRHALDAVLGGLYLRFATPSRSARVRQLLGAASQREDASGIIHPRNLSIQHEGLPYPLEFVQDLGSHVAPVQEQYAARLGLDRNECLRSARANLATSAQTLRLPAQGLALFDDPDDHGAACVILLPSMLAEGQTVLCVAPGPSALAIWTEGDRAAAAEARRIIDHASLAEAPLPNPIRVTPHGFSPAPWKSLLGQSGTPLHVH